ncbi:CsoS2 family carboxysome shell protein, partial [Aphanothece microscopica]|uniref:CsoS2 family carboxysome shell protein n=1 Tax=Aphanothece microscopica TaxID=1049561 RepID=UPI003984A210
GTQQYAGFCGTKPQPEAPKVGFSITTWARLVMSLILAIELAEEVFDGLWHLGRWHD